MAYPQEIISPPINLSPIPKNNNALHVAEIKIVGNLKTKSYIISREIPFKVGDSISLNNFEEILHTARNQVYNLNLFTEVFIEPTQIIGSELYITVKVLERWYIYPTPQFQLVDRNFNEWINVYNASLKRVNYGVKFVHYNLSGRKDELRIFLINGYSRNLSFSYLAPYSSPNLKTGFAVGVGVTQYKEIPYKTNYQNKPLQYNKGKFAGTSFAMSAALIKRKGFYDRKTLSVGYAHVSVTDSINHPAYNPLYFNNGKSKVGFVEISFAYQYFHTDNNNYPLQGVKYNYQISKRGLGWRKGINKLELTASAIKYIPHAHQWYSSISAAGLLKLPFKQAYYNQRAIGYENFNLRGLEYYVIDGVAAAIAKYTLKKKLVSFHIPMPIKIKSIPKIPIALYAKTFTDVGYCYNDPSLPTRLNNTFLYTGGIGLDILSIYDSNFSLDYSFNQLGQKGLFLSFKLGF